MIVYLGFRNHKLLFVTKFIFHNNPKAYGKILLDFCQGNQGDTTVTLGLAYKKHLPCSTLFIGNKLFAYLRKTAYFIDFIQKRLTFPKTLNLNNWSHYGTDLQTGYQCYFPTLCFYYCALPWNLGHRWVNLITDGADEQKQCQKWRRINTEQKVICQQQEKKLFIVDRQMPGQISNLDPAALHAGSTFSTGQPNTDKGYF